MTTDCLLNYICNTWKFQAQTWENMLCTDIVSDIQIFSQCSAKRRASDKDLPVQYGVCISRQSAQSNFTLNHMWRKFLLTLHCCVYASNFMYFFSNFHFFKLLYSLGCIMFGPFWSVWCKIVLGEVTPMMMPRPCPSGSRLPKSFFKSHNFFIMEKWPVSAEV